MSSNGTDEPRRDEDSPPPPPGYGPVPPTTGAPPASPPRPQPSDPAQPEPVQPDSAQPGPGQPGPGQPDPARQPEQAPHPQPPFARQPTPLPPPPSAQTVYPGAAAPQQPPYAQAGYPGGAPQQPAAYGSQPGYPSTPPPPKKGLGAGVVIAIVASGLVVVVGIVAVVAVLTRLGGGPTAGGEKTAETTPAGIVQGYLEALAAADAETALSFVSDPPAASPFLTDDALAASNALGPITDIEVSEPVDADFSAYVTATYSVGDVPVTTDFSVNEYETEGSWKMTAVTADLELGGRFSGLAITLNGQPVASSSVEVFPGTYELATTTPNFAITGETIVTVREPFDFPRLSDLNAGLSEEGVLVFRQAVQDAVAACIAAKTFVAGCGLDVPQVLDDGSRLAEGTLTRSLRAETQATLDTLAPRETFSDPLLVSGEFLGGVNVTAGLEGGGTGDLLFGPSLGIPLVDFTTGTPVVRWD